MSVLSIKDGRKNIDFFLAKSTLTTRHFAAQWGLDTPSRVIFFGVM